MSRAELTLHRGLIVRRMVLSVPGKDGAGSNDYLVETRGTVRPAGCPPVAESGRYRRAVKPEGRPEYVHMDYAFRFVAVSARLTDEEYDKMTRIEPGPKAVTIDTRQKK